MKSIVTTPTSRRITANTTSVKIQVLCTNDAGVNLQANSITYRSYSVQGTNNIKSVTSVDEGYFKTFTVTFQANNTTNPINFGISFTLSANPSTGVYEYSTTKQTNIYQQATNDKPFILEKHNFYINYNESETLINFVRNTDTLPGVTKIGEEYEYLDYLEDNFFEIVQGQIIKIKAGRTNMTNKTYVSKYRIQIGDYYEDITITHFANPNAPQILFFTAETQVRPFSANPENISYHMKLITDKPINTVSVKWLHDVTLVTEQYNLIDYHIYINTHTEEDGKHIYDIIAKQMPGSNNLGETVRQQWLQFLASDDLGNQIVIEKLIYIQEGFGHVYVDPVVSDYLPKQFISIPIEGDYRIAMIEPLQMPDWLTYNIDTQNHAIRILELKENDSSTPRTFSTTIKFSLNLVEKPGGQMNFTFTQEGKPATLLNPAWKKHYITMTPDNNYFSVRINNEEIYKSEYINNTIEISDLVSPYIETPKLMLDYRDYYITRPTVIQVFSGNKVEQTTLEHTCQTIWDYSYKALGQENFFLTGETQCINFIDPRQFLVCSMRDFNHAAYNATVFELDEYGRTIHSRNLNTTGQYESIYTYIHQIHEGAAKIGFHEDKIINKTYLYDVKCTKAKYCLYYLNPWGCWNWCLFEGKSIESDSIKRNTYMSNIDNVYSTEFENNNYMETVNTSWNLTTGYIKDKYSVNFRYLVQSPKAYLHDLDENIVYAVNIDSKAVDVKTFRNNGRKFATYSVKVNFAQNKYIFS